MSSTMAPSASSASRQIRIRDLGAEQADFQVLNGLEFLEGLGNLCPDGFLRHQVHLQMQLAQLRRRARSDGGNAHAADVAQVLERLEKVFKERRDAVGAGEHEPVVGIQFEHRIQQVLPAGRRDRLMQGISSTSAPSSVSGATSSAACARARVTTTRWPNSGRLLKPVQFLAQFHHVADDRERGRRDLFLGRELFNGAERADDGFLTAQRAPLHDGHGCFGRHRA